MNALRARTLILGAGYSGLACGELLFKQGYGDGLLLLEGRRRAGGRALSDSVMANGKIVDRGPEFFGRNHHTLLRLAKQHGVGLRLMQNYEGPFSPLLPGCGLSLETCRAAEREMDSAALQLIAEAERVNLAEPWNTPNAEQLDSQSLEHWLSRQQMSELARKTFRVQVVANHGVSLDSLSLLAFLLIIKAHGTAEYLPDTEVYRLEGGAQELAKRMALGLGDKLLFGEEVVRIENGEHEVKVVCRSGKTIVAEHLVLTTPPSTWGGIEFQPALPARYQVQMGQNVKVFVVLEGNETFQAGLSPASVQQDGLLQLLWDSTEGQEALGETMVITCFSGGDAAVRLGELDPSALRELVLRELSPCVPRLSERLRDVRMKVWPKSQFTRCGYSAPAPGQICGEYRALNEGWGRVLFGGEHCARQLAFVNGAMNSGERNAATLITDFSGTPFEVGYA